MRRILNGLLVLLLLSAAIGRDHASALGARKLPTARVDVDVAAFYDDRASVPPSPPRKPSSRNIAEALETAGGKLNARLSGDPELRCLAEAIYFEARSETLSGQLAVAQVVLNRVRNPEFPHTICGVVYQPGSSKRGCQFSFACDGLLEQPLNLAAWNLAEKIGFIARKGLLGDITGAALYYHRNTVMPSWRVSLAVTRRVGDHIFYRNAKA